MSAFSGSLCACSPSPVPARSPVSLRVGIAAPAAGLPGEGVPQFVSGYLTSESLIGVGWDGRPVARLASEWAWADDRLSLRLQLHPNIRFHDGTRLEAPLAREFFQGVVNPSTPAPFTVSFASVTRVTSDDPLSLTFHLSRPEAFLLEDLATVQLPHPTAAGFGTGPFKLMAADGEGAGTIEVPTVTRLEAFPDYYRGRAAVDLLEVRGYDEQRSAWAALVRGDIDAVHEVSPSAIDLVEGQKNVRTYSVVRPYYIALWFNLRHSVLKDARIRRALSFAVDRRQLVEEGLSGRGEPSAGPVWPYHWAYTPAERAYSLNREAATIQLDMAGRRVKRQSADGRASRFRFACLTLAGDRYEKVALLLQRQLYDIGIDMAIDALPLRDVLQRVQSGNFETLLLERSSGRSLGLTYATFHSRSSPVGYRATDSVLDRMRAATTDHALRETVNEFHRVLYDDPPAIFLAWPTVTRAVRTNFVVPDEPSRTDVMSSLRLWHAAEPPE
ncbi:MAG TPA: ABC transporter substrate-binding protein [Vicinamibacterales bacterium]|nr:ABC transporter substrate-binding protein [Vicinamibacterales bacterium]